MTQTGSNDASTRLRLVGGANFSLWPDLKWARGRAHAASLESSFLQWTMSGSVYIEGVLRSDRQGIDLVARIVRGIPTHEWALLLGDSLHNFRSAFDAIVWGMAHFDGAKPGNPLDVAFPIYSDRGKWDKAMERWIGKLNPEFQQRLYVVQPFNDAGSGGPSLLRMLHDLDIQDKHKNFLTVSIDANQVFLDGLMFKYEGSEPLTPAHLEMNTDVAFRDGAVLGTFHAEGAIQLLETIHLRPGLQILLTWQDQIFDVPAMLAQLVAETRRYLDILMHGLASSNEDEREWSPLQVGDVEADSQIPHRPDA